MTIAFELNDLRKALVDGALISLRSNKGWADKAIEQLPDEKLHLALDSNTNCIAVIMKHLAGNLLSRWTDFLTTDGEKPWRNRDDEFVDTITARNELIGYWNSGWQRLFESLAGLSPVSGRSKGASAGRLKISHFERSEIRPMAPSVSLVLKEARYGESSQNGDGRFNTSITCATLVATADRRRAAGGP